MRIRTDMRKYCQRNLEKKCEMYMIIIKIDCCGHPQMLCSLSIWTSSDIMQTKGLSTSSFGLCSFQDILNIHLYVHISKALILLVKVFVMVHVSAP